MKQKTKSRLAIILPIIAIVTVFLTLTDIGVSLWSERANVTISFGHIDSIPEYLPQDKHGYYSAIIVSNVGKDKASFDLVVSGKNAQVSPDGKNWSEITNMPILPEPKPNASLYSVYILPDPDSETFTITLSHNKSKLDFQQIDIAGVIELTYKKDLVGNYKLVE